MRSYRDIIGLAFLLILFVGAGVLLTKAPQTTSHTVGPEDQPDASVYNDRASGSKGFYNWTAAMGYKPQVWRQSWSELNSSDAAVLVSIAPQADESFSPLTGSAVGSDPNADTILTDADAATLKDWLSAGHTAILLASRLPGRDSTGDDSDTFADSLDLIAETAIRPDHRTDFAPLQPLPLIRGIISVYIQSDSRFRRKSDDAIAVFGDRSGPAVICLPVGRGRLYAIADDRFASNADLPRAENAILLANMLASGARRGETVLFDEYHHGDAALAAGVTVWSVLGRPLQLFLIQLALAAIALVVLLSVRFGSAIPLRPAGTRLSSEYVSSLAILYRRAQASPAALETIYRQFLRDLSSRLALPSDVALEQLAESAARRGNLDKNELRHLLATCEQRMDDKRVSEADLINLTRHMERVRKEIGIA